MPWQTPLVVRNNSPRAEGFLYGFYPGGETPAITIYPLRGFGREQGAGGRDIVIYPLRGCFVPIPPEVVNNNSHSHTCG